MPIDRPGSPVQSATRISDRAPTRLERATSNLRLRELENRPGASGVSRHSAAPGKYQTSALHRADQIACDLIAKAAASDKHGRAELQKFLGWMNGEGGRSLQPRVHCQITSMAAAHAALKCDAQQALEKPEHAKWADILEKQIVSLARAAGACKEPPSGCYLGKGTGRISGEQLKAELKLAECAAEVGGDALIEGIILNVLDVEMQRAFLQELGVDVARAFGPNGLHAANLKEALSKVDLSTLEQRISDALMSGDPESVRLAILEVFKLPELVVKPVSAKKGPDNTDPKSATQPASLPELLERSRGAPVLYNNSPTHVTNDLSGLGNLLEGGGALKLESLRNLLNDSFDNGYRLGRAEERVDRLLALSEDQDKTIGLRNADIDDLKQRLADKEAELGHWVRGAVVSQPNREGEARVMDDLVRSDAAIVVQKDEAHLVTQFSEPDTDVPVFNGEGGEPSIDLDDESDVEYVDRDVKEFIDELFVDEKPRFRTELRLKEQAEQDALFKDEGDAFENQRQDGRNVTSSNVKMESLDDEPELDFRKLRAKFEAFKLQGKNAPDVVKPIGGTPVAPAVASSATASQTPTPSKASTIIDVDRGGRTVFNELNNGDANLSQVRDALTPHQQISRYFTEIKSVAEGHPTRIVQAGRMYLREDGPSMILENKASAEALDSDGVIMPSDYLKYAGRKLHPGKVSVRKQDNGDANQIIDYKKARAALKSVIGVEARPGSGDETASAERMWDEQRVAGSTFGRTFQQIRKSFEQQEVQETADRQDVTVSAPASPATVPQHAMQEKPFAFPDGRDASLVTSTLRAGEPTRPGNPKGGRAVDLPAMILRNRANAQGLQQRSVISMLNSTGSSVANTDISSSEESDSDTGVHFAIPRPKQNYVGKVNEIGIPLVSRLSF